MDILEIITLCLQFFYSLVESIINVFIPSSWRSKNISLDKVLITGASSGVGRQLSYEFAKRGCELILWDIDERGLAETASECSKLGTSVKYYKCDLSNREEIYMVADKVKNEVGKIDILVNNAGIVSGQKFLDIPDDKINLTMNVNTMAHFWTLKSFLPSMMENNHGHVVSVASVAGKFGSPGLLDYCASKFASVGIDSALRTELYQLKKTGVHTTCVCPGFITTGLFSGLENTLFARVFVPTLTPEYAASKIMEAVLTNQQMLIMPRICYLLFTLESILPTKAGLVMCKLVGALDAMDSFKGREKSE